MSIRKIQKNRKNSNKTRKIINGKDVDNLLESESTPPHGNETGMESNQ